jgi:hypothetical protein
MLEALTNWFAALWNKSFVAAWDFVQDALIAAFDACLHAVGSLLSAIPVPQWMTGGLQGLFDGLGGATLYLLIHTGVAPALAILGAGFAFRMSRKFLTLFQW